MLIFIVKTLSKGCLVKLKIGKNIIKLWLRIIHYPNPDLPYPMIPVIQPDNEVWDFRNLEIPDAQFFVDRMLLMPYQISQL